MSPPPNVRTTTILASPVQSTCSGDASWTSTSGRLSLGKGLGLLEHRLDAADVEERLLGDVVEVAAVQRVERFHRLRDRHVDAGQTGEHLADEERLRQELLN